MTIIDATATNLPVVRIRREAAVFDRVFIKDLFDHSVRRRVPISVQRQRRPPHQNSIPIENSSCFIRLGAI
jgi:hypothetical protein